jgi:hypothetical protein
MMRRVDVVFTCCIALVVPGLALQHERLEANETGGRAGEFAASDAVDGYRMETIEGWPVYVSERLRDESPDPTRRAMDLLAVQLRWVKANLPKTVVARLTRVPLFLSPPYDGFGQKAEYHPNKQWLIQNGRRPALHRAIEFTNVAIFKRDIERMPVMVLHELAHAYHDQVLGFDHPRVKALYEAAKASGAYESVLRGDGKTARAYALSNEREYFAETSEAFFGRNDFYPFERDDLAEHDPRMARLLAELWRTDVRR